MDLARGIEHGGEIELPGGPDAVLLLHGLTGSTFEVSHVAQRLHREGMRCLAPVMAGHGGSAEVLAGVPWVEWVGKARRDLARLEGARRTFVAGCSMGALVACVLAHDELEKIDGLVLLAPALELSYAGKVAALIGRLPFLRGTIVKKRGGSDVSDPKTRRRNPCMDAVPLAAVAELASLASHVNELLPDITAPAIVIIGAQDHTVTVRGARRLADQIGSGPADLVLLERSWHLVGMDVDRDRCADEAARFLDGLPIPKRRPARTSGRRNR